MRDSTNERRAVRMEQSIAIDVPVEQVCSHWTHFDWRGENGAQDIGWSAANLEIQPDRRVAWRSGSGARFRGVVDFHPLGDERTWVALQIDCVPVTLLERLDCSLGLVAAAVARELRRFKETIETAKHRLGCYEERRREIERFQSLIERHGDSAASSSSAT